jgi:hypothetical protein
MTGPDRRSSGIVGVSSASPRRDITASNAKMPAGCRRSHGGPAAAKVVKADVHPIKDDAGGSARERMVALQGVLASKAPPWLAKVMGRTHYLTAITGQRAADFVQIEIEELQEIIHRPLWDPDWLPDDLADCNRSAPLAISEGTPRPIRDKSDPI